MSESAPGPTAAGEAAAAPLASPSCTAPSFMPETIAPLLHEVWMLAGGFGLFHDGQRDWPWLLYLRRRSLAGRDVTLGEICGFLGSSYPTARRIVQTLEDRGYLEVRKDGFDKRRSILRFTGEGERQMLAYEEQAAALLSGRSALR